MTPLHLIGTFVIFTSTKFHSASALDYAENCPAYGFHYDGNDLDIDDNPKKDVKTWDDCRLACQGTHGCEYWTYGISDEKCWMKGIRAKGILTKKNGRASYSLACTAARNDNHNCIKIIILLIIIQFEMA